MNKTELIQQHYAAPNLLSRIEAGLKQAGKSTNALTIDDLAPIDEFHLRGPAATAELIDLLAPDPTTHVLDVGSGLGGPARRLAKTVGCRVTGVDLSQEYCTVGMAINGWLDLETQINLVHGDATALTQFDTTSFDV